MTALIKDLTTLLPHRAPSILLDEVLDYGDDHASAVVRINAASKFFDARQSGVPAWVGVEYMAQTLAIWAGYQRLRSGKPVNVAFIVAVRQFRSNVALFCSGAELIVNAKTLFFEDSAAVFDCEIVGAECLVNARISAVSPDSPQEITEKK
jgi:predicted hotdog family 3-hydroxylacyl-ACP dehydratase